MEADQLTLYEVTFVSSHVRYVAASSIEEAKELSSSIRPEFEGFEKLPEIYSVLPEELDESILIDCTEVDTTIADFIAQGHRLLTADEALDECVKTAPGGLLELVDWHMNRPRGKGLGHRWLGAVANGFTYVSDGYGSLRVDGEAAHIGGSSPWMVRQHDEIVEESTLMGSASSQDVEAWAASSNFLVVAGHTVSARIIRLWMETALSAAPCDVSVSTIGENGGPVVFQGDGWCVVVGGYVLQEGEKATSELVLRKGAAGGEA